MIVIGVTGSLASGKSEVAAILRGRGALVFDADSAARKMIRKGRPAYRAVVKLFGRGYLRSDGQIDRKKLAARVFTRSRDLKKLNTLVHPAVIVDFMRRIYAARRRKGMIVLDVPLLYESKMQNLADVTVVVSAPLSTMLARAGKKGIPARLAWRILSSQWPLKRKEKLADFVIRNNGSKAELKKKVLKVLDEIQAIVGSRVRG